MSLNIECELYQAFMLMPGSADDASSRPVTAALVMSTLRPTISRPDYPYASSKPSATLDATQHCAAARIPHVV
jgi:hypothetical protein